MLINRAQPPALFGIKTELVAQLAGVGIDGAGADVGADTPDRVEEIGARQQAPDVSEQEHRHFKFLLRQLDRRPVLAERAAVRIDVEGAGLDRLIAVATVASGAAQERLDAGKEFHPPKRLDEVIVCARFERVDDVLLAVLPGGEEHRQRLADRFADRPEHFFAGQIGHAPVEDDQIEGVAEHRPQDVVAAVVHAARDPLRAEPVLHQLGLRGIVLEHRDSRGARGPCGSLGGHFLAHSPCRSFYPGLAPVVA